MNLGCKNSFFLLIFNSNGVLLDLVLVSADLGFGFLSFFFFQYSVRAGGSGDEGKVARRKETNSWKIDFSGEKPATPLLDTINYPIHMKNLSTRVSMFMDLVILILMLWMLVREICNMGFDGCPFFA